MIISRKESKCAEYIDMKCVESEENMTIFKHNEHAFCSMEDWSKDLWSLG